MSSKIKAVIFDVDNTLIDFMKIKRECVYSAAEAMIDAGLSMSMEEIMEHIYSLYWESHIEDQKTFQKFLKNVCGAIDYEILGCAIAEYRRKKHALMATYPMVRKTLLALIKMGIKLGVISDAPRVNLYTRIAHLKLNKYFDYIVTAEDVGKKYKPDPAGFLYICDLMGVKPKECIMVGDWDERDMVGAKNVGMLTAFAKYGDEWDIKTPSSDYILHDNIYELVDIIGNINE